MPVDPAGTTQPSAATVLPSAAATEQAIPASGGKAYAQSRTFKAAVLSLGKVLAQCSRILSAAILSRVLTVEGYATLRQTFLAYDAGEPLLQMGLPQALYYFLPGEKKRARGVLIENLLLLSLSGGAFGVFLALGGNRLLALRFNNPALEQSLLLLVPYALVSMPASALAACLLARGRAVPVAIFSVIERLVLLALVVFPVLVWRSAEAGIAGTMAGSAVMLVPALLLMFRSTRDGTARPTLRGMWDQFKYSIFLGLAGALGTFTISLDKLIVSSMCQPEAFAIYANGAIEVPLFSVLTGSVLAVILPDIRRLYKEGRFHEALALWQRGAKKCALIVFPVMWFLLAMAPDLVCVLFSAKYADSALPFRLYQTLLPLRVVVWGAMLMAAGKSHLILIRTAVECVLSLVLCVLYVKSVGYMGAVLGTVQTLYMFSTVFNLIVIARLYKVRVREVLPLGAVLKMLLVSFVGCVALVPVLFVKTAGTAGAILRLGIAAPAYAGTILLLFVWFGILDLHPLLQAVKRRIGR
ncbi:MAG: oligosaccharide flippase family protein [Planctomycetota bacterium]|nr:oligosaccharide flippase family protein [Planctomycetota bacterium]